MSYPVGWPGTYWIGKAADLTADDLTRLRCEVICNEPLISQLEKNILELPYNEERLNRLHILENNIRRLYTPYALERALKYIISQKKPKIQAHTGHKWKVIISSV